MTGEDFFAVNRNLKITGQNSKIPVSNKEMDEINEKKKTNERGQPMLGGAYIK